MPTDSYYDKLDAYSDKLYEEQKKEIESRYAKMTLEEKVEILIHDKISEELNGFNY